MSRNTTTSEAVANITTSRNFQYNTFEYDPYNSYSTIYWITGIILLVILFIICIFCIICYFACIARAKLLTRNHASRLNFMSNLDRSTSVSVIELNEAAAKPPGYDNIVSYSELDKLPTYNSFRKSKGRNNADNENSTNVPTTPHLNEIDEERV